MRSQCESHIFYVAIKCGESQIQFILLNSMSIVPSDDYEYRKIAAACCLIDVIHA